VRRLFLLKRMLFQTSSLSSSDDENESDETKETDEQDKKDEAEKTDETEDENVKYIISALICPMFFLDAAVPLSPPVRRLFLLKRLTKD
jgi:U3 small nucleolar RNA-associated protein 14